MNKKIFPNEWRASHPYNSSDVTDLYYTALSNKVLVALNGCGFNDVLDPKMLRRVAIAFTAWFEDVISNFGIWRAFTTECKRRYGTYLPFYDTSEGEYFPDEINLVDVQFLLWHFVQQDCMGESMINPENKGLVTAARKVYDLFDKEYEVAPENARLCDFFENIEVSTPAFYQFRDIIEWFCYDCYFNIWNVDRFYELTMNYLEVSDVDERDGDEYLKLMMYNLRVDYLLSARHLLALNSCQWLALIINDPKKKAMLEAISYKRFVRIDIDRRDEGFMYAREIGEDGESFRVTLDSLDEKKVMSQIGRSAVTSLLYFDGVWWVSGTIMQLNRDNAVEAATKEDEQKRMVKSAYDLFVDNSKGKKMLFFRDTDEYKEYVQSVYQFKGDSSSFLPKEVEGQDLFVCGNKDGGIYTQFNVCSILKHSDNPLYDKKEAREYAHVVLLDEEVPYQVSTMMIDEGLLVDARMNSDVGKRHGHALMQNNIYFLNDYFRNRCRDLDYNDN